MPQYSLQAIGEILDAKVTGNPKSVISHLAIDSRLDYPFPETMFIAIKGAKRNGHDHIKEMYDKGVRAFLVEEETDQLPDAGFVHVDGTLKALQSLAKHHRSKKDVTVVGITGSNGKTIVKEWLNDILREDRSVVRSPGSWNSRIGVPLSVWNIEDHHEIGIFEAGISEPGEMEILQPIINPHIGIFTNIGPAHSEGFKDERSKAMEKALLFTHSEHVICCRDHDVVISALNESGIDEGRITSWSRKQKSYLRILEEKRKDTYTNLIVRCEGKAHEIKLPFTDDASIENAMHCLLTGLVVGLELDQIRTRLMDLEPLEMRLQVLEGINGATILNDAYSNDKASLRIALDRLESIASGRKKTVILSDFHGTGENGEDLYSGVEKMLHNSGIENRFFIGPQWREHFSSQDRKVYEDADSLIADLKNMNLRNKAILIKGARRFRLEIIAKRLQAKSHGTVLEIDLGAIKHNLDIYRSKLDASTRIMVMLKAFGYGSGPVEMARVLTYDGVEHFGVAYPNEGIELRQNGITTPILVMNPAETGWEVFSRFGLEPSIYSIEQMESLIAHCEASGSQIPIHLELDTGMHRLGFMESEIEKLCSLLSRNPELNVLSIFSHLAASEDPASDEFTESQISEFRKMADLIGTYTKNRPLLHILNSAGIIRHPGSQFDMVRLGIGLYGYDVAADENLIPALSLRSSITQIKTISEGESVGYSRSFIADRPTRIAIVPMGYADGLNRGLSNGKGSFWINGKSSPVVGRICMDMTMVDVTDVDCSIGDLAILFDAKHGLMGIADAVGTIPYEILTALSQRIERRYVRDI